MSTRITAFELERRQHFKVPFIQSRLADVWRERSRKPQLISETRFFSTSSGELENALA